MVVDGDEGEEPSAGTVDVVGEEEVDRSWCLGVTVSGAGEISFRGY